VTQQDDQLRDAIAGNLHLGLGEHHGRIRQVETRDIDQGVLVRAGSGLDRVRQRKVGAARERSRLGELANPP
jgi:hypothetical protein